MVLAAILLATSAFLIAVVALSTVRRPDPRVRGLESAIAELERLYDDNLRMLKRINSREGMREVRENKKGNGQDDGCPDSVVDPAGFKKWQRKRLKIGPA